MPRGSRKATALLGRGKTIGAVAGLLSPRGRGKGVLLLAAGLAAAVLGCAAPRVPTPPLPDLPPQAVLQSLQGAAVRVPLMATARIEVRRFGERLAGRAALMIQHPNRLRYESLPPLGPPDFFLSLDGNRLAAFDPAQGAFYRGQATAANLARFLPLALPPARLVPLLLGQPPEEGEGTLQGRWEGGLYRIDRQGQGERGDTLWIDPAGQRLVRWEGASGEGTALTAAFAEPAAAGGGIVPRHLTLEVSGVTVQIRYTDLLTRADGEAVFDLALPAGIRPQSLD